MSTQAIETKVLPATNSHQTRIKAFCARGSLTHSFDFSGPLDSPQVHRAAAILLANQFIAEDMEKYGSSASLNPWGRPLITGCLPSGNFAHVFTEGTK